MITLDLLILCLKQQGRTMKIILELWHNPELRADSSISHQIPAHADTAASDPGRPPAFGLCPLRGRGQVTSSTAQHTNAVAKL